MSSFELKWTQVSDEYVDGYLFRWLIQRRICMHAISKDISNYYNFHDKVVEYL